VVVELMFQRPPSRRSSHSSDAAVSDADRKRTRSGRGTCRRHETALRQGQRARRRRVARKRKSHSQSESDSDGSVSCPSDWSRVSFDPVPSDTEPSSAGILSHSFSGLVIII